MQKKLKTYTPLTCSHASHVNAKLIGIIRRERNIIESLRPYDNETARAMRLSAHTQIRIAQDMLNASHGGN